MLNTGDLHTLTQLADDNDWRVVLLGDPHQLHAVGRGGMFDDICANGRLRDLTTIHRFTNPWEASASLELRRGISSAIDRYVFHGRVAAGSIDDHLTTISERWQQATAAGKTIAITATTNEHVELINRSIQQHRLGFRSESPQVDHSANAAHTDGVQRRVVFRRAEQSPRNVPRRAPATCWETTSRRTARPLPVRRRRTGTQ